MTIRAVVFDWAGTIIDFGSLAPMGAFVKLFANHGIEISIAQARVPMGLPKLAHIKALGQMPAIADQWQTLHGQSFSDADAESLLREFEPMSARAALEHSDFIPGFLETYAWLKSSDIGVATTTGYTRTIMTPLIALAKDAGFDPTLVVCCDDVAKSRPDPMGMQRCMEALGLVDIPQLVVKVDDTEPGLQEGRNAGCWAVGVAASGNALGWSLEQWNAANLETRAQVLAEATECLIKAGAHEVVASVADLGRALERIAIRMNSGETP